MSDYIDWLLKEETKRKAPLDYGKIKISAKQLDDAILNIGTLKRVDPYLANKDNILKAIYTHDLETMRAVSNLFFRTSGIYSRICRYMAYLYRYDWFVTPYIKNKNIKNTDKISDNFYTILDYLDDFGIKKFCGDTTLKIIKDGCYYGYLIDEDNTPAIQELPIRYCRSRFKVNDLPAIEFNMSYFDDSFPSSEYRTRILNLFPKEFKKGYNLYKKGELKGDYPGDGRGWYLLDPNKAFKLSLNNEDYPAFISIVPSIIDLDEAQELDKKKMQQKLLKIIIQQMPLDKNGDLIFDPDEAQTLHNNAVQMLGKAVGVDVLTTFADVQVADMSDRGTTTARDELEKVERAIYNEAGVSQMQFNTSGNLALEKSILNDEASIYNLLLQYERLFNNFIKRFQTIKKVKYRVHFLTTTIYNYQDMAKLYKEQVTLGYSKILPQLAMGQSQSSILANAYFENEILDLVNIFIPPMSSNTMSSSIQKKETSVSEEKEKGRPKKEDDQKAEKTIQNQESLS